LWRWAIGCGAYGLTASPADRLGSKALVGSKKSRTRTLSDIELRCLWQALDAEQYPWQTLYKLLVMSGQRLSDVGGQKGRCHGHCGEQGDCTTLFLRNGGQEKRQAA
jgi:hypothetical protein